jgi:hypothetical protein
VPRYRLTCTGVAPSSDAGLPLIPGREIPLSRRTGTPCPRGEHPFSEGRGYPFSQERVPPTRGRLPLLRERAYLFRWTADPFPGDVYPITDERVPSSEGRGLHFRGTFVPRLGGTGTPFPTDGHPFSEGGGALPTEGSRYPSDANPVPWDACPLFRTMGPPIPRDGGPASDGWVPLSPRTGTPLTDGRGPFSAGRGTPSQRSVGKEIISTPGR